MTTIDLAAAIEAVLVKHQDVTDRSADDGCSCGYPHLDVPRHQAEQIVKALPHIERQITERVKPSRDDIARTLRLEFGSFLAHDPHDPEKFWGLAADRILALLPGKSEAEVKAEAWDEGAKAAWDRSTPEVNGQNFHWRHEGLPLNPYRADVIERGGVL